MQSSKNSPRTPSGAYARLTQPLVRDNGVLRPATWDEALDRAAEGFRRNLVEKRAHGDRNLQLLEVDQRGQLPGVEDSRGRCSGTTTSTAAIGPDTLPRVVGLTTILGAGGSTSSYEEAEHCDFVFLWGSNAREAHPIWFHHLLKGIQNGARLYVVDPRRTTSAAVGRRVARPQRRSRHRARQHHGARDHPRRARRHRVHQARHDRLRGVSKKRSSRTRSSFGERVTGIPADVIRDAAHAYATADRAMICWTLGITEHHNAVDNVLALINLVAAHRTRRALRLRLQSAPRAEQRAGRRRHGRAAEQAARFPGRHDRRAPHEVRARVGTRHHPEGRLESHRDDPRDGDEGAHRALRHRRESGAVGRRHALT